jgi:hypothetical protein
MHDGIEKKLSTTSDIESRHIGNRLLLLRGLLRGLGGLAALAVTWNESAEDLRDKRRHSLFSTDLITPTATVCLMSRTAKRPSGG